MILFCNWRRRHLARKKLKAKAERKRRRLLMVSSDSYRSTETAFHHSACTAKASCNGCHERPHGCCLQRAFCGQHTQSTDRGRCRSTHRPSPPPTHDLRYCSMHMHAHTHMHFATLLSPNPPQLFRLQKNHKKQTLRVLLALMSVKLAMCVF